MAGSRSIGPTRTPARLAWLRKLARDGIGRRAKTRVGFECMRLGWTQWARSCSGETITEQEFDRRFPPGVLRNERELNDPRLDPRWAARLAAYDAWPVVGETLTDEGRAVLARWERDMALQERLASASA